MSGLTVRVHAFKISKADKGQTFEAILKKIKGQPVSNRQRSVGREKAYIRMDDVTEIEPGLWLMDFVLRRYEGPGRSPDNAKTSAFRLGKADRFGEETAGLYHVKSRRLLLQYNHRGVKLGKALEYMAICGGQASDGFDGLFEIDPEWRAKLNRRTIPRGIEAAVAPGHLTEADRKSNMAIRHAMDMADHTGANKVYIKLMASGSKEERLKKTIFEIRDRLMSLSSKKPEAVQQLIYTGKEKIDEKATALDLLKCRLEHVEKEIAIGVGRRVDQNVRYDLVRRAWDKWRQHFKK